MDLAHRNHYFDTLRGVAVVLVLFFHIFPGFLPSGFLGVDIFFVLACYFSVRSLDKRSDSLAGLNFYPLARVRRLAAAAFIVLMATAVFALLLIPSPDDAIMRDMHQAVIGLGFDDYLTRSGSGYFQPSQEFNTYLHLWTISVEVKYYALIYLLCLGAWLLAAWNGCRLSGQASASPTDVYDDCAGNSFVCIVRL